MPDSTSPPLLLYVEDELLIQHDVTVSLEEAGFKLVVADNGEQALRLLAAHSTALRGLVTDVNLGKGPDGWEVARAARQSVGGLPVVYPDSASHGLFSLVGGLFAGADGFAIIASYLGSIRNGLPSRRTVRAHNPGSRLP